MAKIIVYFQGLNRYPAKSDADFFATRIGSLTYPVPGYSLWDEFNRIKGFASVPTLRIYQEMLSTDLISQDLVFKIPVYFFQGTEDVTTPTSLAKEYFDRIEAPHKECVPFPGGGHFTVWSMADQFLRELISRLR